MRRRSPAPVAACIVLASLGGAAAMEPPQPTIAVAELRVSGEADKEQRFLAEIINDLLPQAVQQSGTKPLGKRLSFWVQPLRIEVPAEGEVELAAFGRELHHKGLQAMLLPELTVSSRGYLLRVQVIDLRDAADPEWSPAERPQEIAAMSGEASFTEVEEQIQELSDRVLIRLAGQPPRRVRFWCINPGPSEDEALSAAGRRLTLELPYFLIEARGEALEGIEFEGVNPQAYFVECVRKGYRQEMQQQPIFKERPLREDVAFTVSGTLFRNDPRRASIEFLVHHERSGINVPLDQSEVHLPVTKEELARIAAEFVERFAASLPRFE